jgi:hypothetical protein
MKSREMTVKVLVMATVMVLSAAPARADLPGIPEGVVNAIPVQVAGPEGDLTALATHLEEMLQDITPVVQVVRISAGDSAAALRKDITEEDRPAAWVLIERGRARVRVAGAGRSRFVFRTLLVSIPMNELDRERTGHALRTALTAVIEGQSVRTEGSPRDDLHRLPLLPEPEVLQITPDVASASEAKPRLEIAARDQPPAPPGLAPGLGWRLGATYEAQFLTICRCGGKPIPAVLNHSLGAVVGWSSNDDRIPYQLFVGGRFHLPMAVERGPTNFTVTGLSVHLGASVAATRAIHVGLAAGVAGFRTRPVRSADVHRDVLALARVFLRVGLFDLGSTFTGSALALFEVTHRGAQWVAFEEVRYEDSRLRPGLGLEIGWQ